MNDQRFSSSQGIAIGPILFIIAILAVLAAAMSSGGGGFQISGTIDRINADITTQANLIRTTVSQCNLQYMMALSSGSVDIVGTDPPGGFPASNTGTGTPVSDLICDPMGSSSLWGAILMPPPTKGFSPWTYINTGETGGRCIWTAPTKANPVNDAAIVAGLTRAAAKFNSSTAVDTAHEVVYDPASASQKFIVWITLPETAGDADSHCEP
ncbi:MAG: hypothetical protein WC521_06840 [Bdellovibrionales bacterium]|jgi:hypothetical protein